MTTNAPARRTAGTALCLAAVTVAVLAAGALVRTWDRSRPGPLPAPSSAAASPPPAAGPVGRHELVAVFVDGSLVVVSASTGRVARTVPLDAGAPGPGDAQGIELAPDRRYAYLTATRPAGTDSCAEHGIERVDLVTGAREPVTRGGRAAVSPDGRRLAYLLDCGGGPARQIAIRDLATGATRTFPADYAVYVADLLWNADGTRLWVVISHDEGGLELGLFDPATDRTLEDARRVPWDGEVELERRGEELVVLRDDCCDGPGDDWTAWITLRAPDGRERELVRAPGAEGLSSAQAGPGGDLLFVRDGQLQRVDPGSGRTLDLGSWTSAAWDW